jgi:hypothetical protein
MRKRDETRSLSRTLHSFLIIIALFWRRRGYALPAGRPARLTCTCRACARMHACMICVISMCRRPEREEDYTSCTTIPALLTQRRKMNLLTHNQLRTRRRPVRCMDWPERAAPPVPGGDADLPCRAARACTPCVGGRGPCSPPRVRKAASPLRPRVKCCKLPRHTPAAGT